MTPEQIADGIALLRWFVVAGLLTGFLAALLSGGKG
jgi:hypothetical protein